MDRETKQQLDEWYVERELIDVREARVSALVDMLDRHDDCLCHEFYRWEALVLAKRERLLRRLARLPLPEEEAIESCAHWTEDSALDRLEAIEDQ